MKKILSAIIALALCASVAVGASGCGCEKNKKTAKNTTSTSSGPGYKVEPTNPDFEEGDFGFYRLNDNEVKVTVYNGKDKDIKIPETVNGSKITVVGANLFQATDVETVTIPEGITEIYPHALNNCTALQSITCLSAVPPTIMDYYEDYDMPFYNSNENAILYVPKGSKNAYQATEWSYYTIVEQAQPLEVVSTNPMSGANTETYQTFSFEVTFNQPVTVAQNNPDVKIYVGEIGSSETLSPLDSWYATMNNENTLHVWGSDYDGYVDYFTSDINKTYYVVIPAGVVTCEAGANEEIIIILNQGASAIDTLVSNGNATIEAIYNINGQQVREMQKGINIVRMSDGTVKKIMK